MRWGLLSIALLVVSGAARAGEADMAALSAYEAHDQHCAALTADETSADTATQMTVVTSAWQDVVRAYDNTGHAYLLYWRGALSQCLGQDERGARDLQLFVELEQFDERFSALVKDARKRLRRMKVEMREPGEKEIEAARAKKAEGGEYSIARDAKVLKPPKQKVTVPFFMVGFGAGYQRLGNFNYVLANLDLSLKLKGPLRLTVSGRPAWSMSEALPVPNAAGEVEWLTRQRLTRMLFGIAAGVELHFATGPVRPRVAAFFQIAPNSGYPDIKIEARDDPNIEVDPSVYEVWPDVLVGAALAVGIDVPLGNDVFALRIQGEIGNLGAHVNAKVGGGFVVGMPGPRELAR